MVKLFKIVYYVLVDYRFGVVKINYLASDDFSQIRETEDVVK